MKLVVVGDQSSGKSSLFRRSATAHEDIVTVTIIPTADAEAAYKQKLEAYNRVMIDFFAVALGKVLDEVSV